MHSYLLQLHTGSFTSQHTTAKEVREKLTPILESLSIKGIILGWNTNKDLNEQLLSYFHQQNILCYLWLPVFSELDALKPASPILSIHGKQGENVSVIEDESFTFFCPTQKETIQYVKEIYEEHFASLSFDGVFLDKIRYPSFANGYEEGFGCFCDQCKARFEKDGVDVSYIKEMIVHHDLAFLNDGAIPTKDTYSDAKLSHFYQVRASWITQAVQELIHYFHNQKKQVGLDVFAPFFAYQVGQDIEQLSKEADFIKPMMYRYTSAPAGMKYEYDAMIQHFPLEEGSSIDPSSIAQLAPQIEALKKASCAIYPGIELNPIEDICTVNSQRLQENLTYVHSSFDTLVCCWNVLLMDQTFLPLLSNY